MIFEDKLMLTWFGYKPVGNKKDKYLYKSETVDVMIVHSKVMFSGWEFEPWLLRLQLNDDES